MPQTLIQENKETVIQRVRDAHGGKVKVKFLINPKHTVAPPSGNVIAGLDFSG
ncbi:hypothetical protein ACQ4M3_09395 [Leptolyngbya sp. AN03gr2]|uniref:hypothetical protein n=1 Tax=Leptolyngbya sp. AN03gr2 TaxID=3423364 RepID=UPI003D31C167